jgi:fatty-acyl-CoA synthase
MREWSSLPEALEAAALGSGAVIFRDGAGNERALTYPQVLQRAQAVAGSLKARGVGHGDRVALLIPEPEPFLLTFLGASVAGMVPVPIYPPHDLRRLSSYLEHTKRIVRVAQPRVVVTTSAIRRLLGTLHAELPELRAILVVDELDGPAESLVARPKMDAPAFIQFTSGSTSTPRGVVLSHANLAANVRALGGPSGIGVGQGDIGVSWLPLFHDMGLIGMALASIYHGVTTVIMPPMVFLRRPAEWLRAISDHRGTISFAPNFAYAYCVRRVSDKALEGVDLSSWRVAGCGAEPIHAATLRAFAARFAKYGFRETALLPCYGMAEHTLAVTFPRPGSPLGVDTVIAGELAERGVAVPCSGDRPDAQSFVCCGRAFPEHEVRIVDEAGQAVPERVVGEIVLSGPSVMHGYVEDAARPSAVPRDGWLHSGDLGYLVDSMLYVCGRKKDMIVLAGRNHYPQDIEWAVSEIEGVRRGGVVAFGCDGFQSIRARIVIVAETKGSVDPTVLRHKLRQVIMASLGLRVDEVVLVPAGTLPKTSSGKLQRARAKARFEAGTLVRQRDSRLGLLRRLMASQWSYLKTAVRARVHRRGGVPSPM